jgi:uncharacterized delta-60 repeat protein
MIVENLPPTARSYLMKALSTSLFLSLAALSLACPTFVRGQALDTTYSPSLTYPPDALGVQADGKLVTGPGYNFTTNSTARTEMFRFSTTGESDSSFSFSGSPVSYYFSLTQYFITGVNSVSCFQDGTAALSGYFNIISKTSSNDVAAPRIFKFNEAGSFVSYAAPKGTTYISPVESYDTLAPYIASLPDNSAFIYGRFNSLNNTQRSGIARLSPSGAFTGSFLPNPGFGLVSNTSSTRSSFYYDIRGVVPQPDGKVLIIGDFVDFNGDLTKEYFVRVDARGALDSTFTPNPNGPCSVLSLQADGKILVAGNFSSIGGGNQSYLARLNANGSLDASFSPVLNSSIYSMQTRVDGKILIAGFFTTVNGSPRGRYAMLNSDGTLATDYASLDASSSVYASAIQNDGNIILGGAFSSIGGTSRSYLARLTPDVAAVNTLTTDDNGTMIEWTRSGSAPEIENAEFRMRLPPATTFATLLGKGVRTATGWKLDKLKLPGNRTFDIQAKGLSRGGWFNNSTSVMSSTLAGVIRPLPQITSAPLTDQTVVLGASGVNFSITATSAATILGYQWSLNGRAIPGATTPTYTIPGGVTVAQGGLYSCVVTSTAGSVTVPPAPSTGARLTVVTPITITKQPVFQAILPGKPASFGVTVTGTSPQYQWYKGSLASPIAIGTNLPTFKIPAVSAADEGDYWVVISNSPNTVTSPVTSNVVKLYEVTVGATVTTAPTHAIFAMNGPATLTATLASESPPVIQWLKNKAPVKDGNTLPLVIPAIKLTDAGKYTVKATNPAGTQTSTPDAEVAVVDQLSTKDFVIAQNGSVVMNAIAAGNGLSYKWKKVGGAFLTDTATGVMPSVAGSLTKTLTIKGLQTTDTASYTCEVTAPGGIMESAIQQVTVTTGPPVISTPFTLPIGMVGAFYDHTVPVDGPVEIRPNKFEAKDLPAGLKIDAFSGRITGRPSLAKSVDTTYAVTISVSNGSGKGLLTQTANLLVRPITGGTALVGTYIGVITPSALGTGFQDGGRIDLTTTTGGAYSGKVTLGTTVTSFTGGRLNVGVTGVTDFNNSNSITIPRRGLPALTVTFDLNVTTLRLENGQITDGAVTSPWSGWKNQWSATNKALLYKGYYTMAMTAPAPAPGDLTYPLGDGYAAFTVADAGTLTVTGRLADGTTFTTSSGFVGPTGQIAVYNSLYTTTGGSLWSDGVTITSAGAPPVGTAPGYLESTVAGSLKWTKRPQTTGYTYAAGFGPLNLTVIGARYATSGAGSNVIGASVLTDDVQLTYTGANVETESVSPNLVVRLTDRNAFVVPTFASGSNPTKTAISLAATTGILTTSFTISEDTDPGPGVTLVNRAAKGMGIVVRSLGTGMGLGYGQFTLIQSPGNATAQILSGRLRVTDVP